MKTRDRRCTFSIGTTERPSIAIVRTALAFTCAITARRRVRSAMSISHVLARKSTLNRLERSLLSGSVGLAFLDGATR